LQPEDARGGEVFLSYNRRDGALVEQIRAALERRNVAVFMDRHERMAGLPWFDELERALKRARAVAVVVGQNGLGGIQKREMQLALERQAKQESEGQVFPVVPVLIDEAVPEDLPGFLRLNTAIDLRGATDTPALDQFVIRVDAPAAEADDAPIVCPYRGLNRFREEDARYFFGREKLTELLLSQVLSQKLVAVVGRSGTGKSSLVQAGLLPQLRRSRPPATAWEIMSFVPDRSPFAELVRSAVNDILCPQLNPGAQLEQAGRLIGLVQNESLPVSAVLDQMLQRLAAGTRLLIVIDQFEEIFRVTSAAERERFLAALLPAVDKRPITLVITLRADFYGQAISYRPLSDLIQNGLVNVGPMSRDELRLATEGPARVAGVQFQAGLVDRLLDQLDEEPGNLPLLEFALEELWTRRERRLIPNAALSSLGPATSNGTVPSETGLMGAIAAQADRTLQRLSAAEQAAALRTFLRLVRVAGADEEGADTRRRVPVSSLSSVERAAAEQFVAARLLVVDRTRVSGDETLDVAHEAVVRHWPRLRQEIHDNRPFLLWRQQLEAFREAWINSERDPSLFLPAASLQLARRWLRTHSQQLNEVERDYIALSARADRRPRRWIIAGVAAALIAASAGAVGVRSYQKTQLMLGPTSLNRYIRAATNLRQAMVSDLGPTLKRDKLSTDVLDSSVNEYNTAYIDIHDNWTKYVSNMQPAGATTAENLSRLFRDVERFHEPMRVALNSVRDRVSAAQEGTPEQQKNLVDETTAAIGKGKAAFVDLEQRVAQFNETLVAAPAARSGD
jgi:hypothetical protein